MKVQNNAGMDLLTTAEAASYLRLRERKLYELVAEQAIPCTKVTGKWLFPRADLDRWLLAGMARPQGVVPAEPPPIVGGSHDPLLQWVLGECRVGLAMLPEGSDAGYQRFLRGAVVAAAIHFHDLEDSAIDANIAVVGRESTLCDAVLFGFAVREQGLLVAPGNPLSLRHPADAAGGRARLAVRPEGAGAQQLLLSLMKARSTGIADFGATVLAPTGPDIAQAIRGGHADCGVATRAVANVAGLDFIPLAREHFDLLVRQRDSYRPAMQAVLDFLRSPAFRERAAELGGLDVSGAGTVRWAP